MSKFKVGQVVAVDCSYPSLKKQLWGYVRIVAITNHGVVVTKSHGDHVDYAEHQLRLLTKREADQY